MDIKGKHYCSRCLAPIFEEIVCPYCGHDPDEIYASCFMEEGTLLSDQRYRVGSIIKEDDFFCYYGGWDYLKDKPVIIKELFPKHLVTRDTFISDNIIIKPKKENQYKEMLNNFVDIWNDKTIAAKIINVFISNGFGYQIFDRCCLPEFL